MGGVFAGEKNIGRLAVRENKYHEKGHSGK